MYWIFTRNSCWLVYRVSSNLSIFSLSSLLSSCLSWLRKAFHVEHSEVRVMKWGRIHHWERWKGEMRKVHVGRIMFLLRRTFRMLWKMMCWKGRRRVRVREGKHEGVIWWRTWHQLSIINLIIDGAIEFKVPPANSYLFFSLFLCPQPSKSPPSFLILRNFTNLNLKKQYLQRKIFLLHFLTLKSISFIVLTLSHLFWYLMLVRSIN